jgi:NADH dehydrogenase (ubiquinone) Fe-S protein 8
MATSRLWPSVVTVAGRQLPCLATFSTSSRRLATPSGPPPKGFRLPRVRRWDESKESAFDKAGNYFLLTEMLRGMYVLLEQFFRSPYVSYDE